MKIEYDGDTFVVETKGYVLIAFFNPDNEFLDGILTQHDLDWKLWRCRVVGEKLNRAVTA